MTDLFTRRVVFILKINRKEIVMRHAPVVTEVNPHSPLSVGNGDFAFTVDITGLQTFPESYKVPLGTQASWGWHTTTFPKTYTKHDIPYETFQSHGRTLSYPLYPGNQPEVYHWLRQNPHRIHLGCLSFVLYKGNGEMATIHDITGIEQRLNLWEGIIYSQFRVDGKDVLVITIAHPEKSELAVKVESSLIREKRLFVKLAFPSPDMVSPRWEESIHINWSNPERHETTILAREQHRVKIGRKLDDDYYEVALNWSSGELRQTAKHELMLSPGAVAEFSFNTAFAPTRPKPKKFTETYKLSKAHWKRFWSSGAAIDFSDCRDSRAHELERRVVLSQFLTAIHSGGSIPPQETGLVYNSWFGKFHLEMHFWHAAHFPLWGRAEILEKSLTWYLRLLPMARDLAQSQGFAGARWPKMIGIDGEQSPSSIAPLLIWQQPHPILLAEFVYQTKSDRQFLEKYKEMVFATARFMVDFVVQDREKGDYILPPPLIPAQENHELETCFNPTFELEYWSVGLEIACQWARRLDEPVPEQWLHIVNHMRQPVHNDKVYLAHENCPDTFTKYNFDHPSMVAALGLLPGRSIDRKIMKQTLLKVKEKWQWETAWGWDFPMCAMTAARLGEPDLALDFLLMDTVKNTYLPNGHNYQSESLLLYLPGNGSLLLAIAMMACGWGNERSYAPGFPKNGQWQIYTEGFHPLPV